ncbi:hypothetical protein [Xanthomonas campestris]|uniref:hypothetical protein n=1 Tax=Xanthomonas TaxID=338 RepID=UPI001E3A552D|nr:hypothetical protein [Xanthomonas campestris]MCC5088683.1 hypothetical protein [Xanthomonas campestris]
MSMQMRGHAAAMVLATAMATGPCAAAALPPELSAHLPAGYTLIQAVDSDLNGDGRRDYLLALRRADEAAQIAAGKDAPQRLLLVLIHTDDGRFVEAARNAQVIFKADDGGQCDPFDDDGQGLVAKGAYFTVQNGVACGQHWTDYITFRYDRTQRAVLFHVRIIEDWVTNPDAERDGEALRLSRHEVIKADPRKPVTLSAYSPLGG